MAVGLKSLATTCDMLTIASLFGIGRSSAHLYFTQFVNAVFNEIVPQTIQFPETNDHLKKMAEDFETMWGFPMVIGAIDGTHIPFNPPTNLTSDFHNYKGWSSVMAIAICDATGKATWIASGFPGRMSDSGAFKGTDLYKKISQHGVMPQTSRTINGVKVPFTILGDSGFALESWLLKPFTYHSALSQNQKIFNYRLSRARRTVENMFGRVKLRWRRLLRGLDVQYERTHKVINVAFALHNICETNGLVVNPTPDEVQENQLLESRFPQPNAVSSRENYNGGMIREKLMEYFASQNQPWSGK